MNTNTYLNESLEELLEVCQARKSSYGVLLNFAKDSFCRNIISQNLHQSEIFIDELKNSHPDIAPLEERNTFISLVFKSFLVFRPVEEYKAKREIFIIAEEIERATIEFYENILTDTLPVPFDIIINNQLLDIRKGYQKVSFIKQALNQI